MFLLTYVVVYICFFPRPNQRLTSRNAMGEFRTAKGENQILSKDVSVIDGGRKKDNYVKTRENTENICMTTVI